MGVNAVWVDTSSGDASPDVDLARSTDGGKTGSKGVNVSGTPGCRRTRRSRATGTGKVAVGWADTSASEKEPDIFLATSSNGGKSFTKAQNVSKTPGRAKEPDVTVAGGKAYAVWEDEDAGKTKVHGVGVALP